MLLAVHADDDMHRPIPGVVLRRIIRCGIDGQLVRLLFPAITMDSIDVEEGIVADHRVEEHLAAEDILAHVQPLLGYVSRRQQNRDA